MFSGIKIPFFGGGRRGKISKLLKEGERLSSRELEREEVLANLLKYFNDFLQESKEEKIKEQLKATLQTGNQKEVLLPYFGSLLVILRKIRSITDHMLKSNSEILHNVEELKALVEQHNRSRWRLIPLDERNFFLDFQKVCNKRYMERQSINNLLSAVSERVSGMAARIEKDLRNPDNIDYNGLSEFLNSEKQAFFEVAKAELKNFGFEVGSLEEISDLEELNQVIFSRQFLDKAKQGKKIITWNNRIRRIAAIYICVFYIGSQLVVPTWLSSIAVSPTSSTRIHYTEVYQKLEQTSSIVHFKSYDNLDISGIMVKNKMSLPSHKAMLLVHGRNYNATWLLPYVNELRDSTQGIDFLSINLRKHGPDTPYAVRATTIGLDEAFDVVGAVNYLAEIGYDEVIVYGHSIGGAAVLNALGKYRGLLSSEIQIKGVIVEKTFANLRDLMRNVHRNLFSNLGVSMAAPLSGAKEFFPKVIPSSDPMRSLTMKLTEKISGFDISENNPSESIRHIDAPVMIIGNKGGDVYMNEKDVGILAANAKHPIPLIVQSEHNSLTDRHIPEFGNPEVIQAMHQFLSKAF